MKIGNCFNGAVAFLACTICWAVVILNLAIILVTGSYHLALVLRWGGRKRSLLKFHQLLYHPSPGIVICPAIAVHLLPKCIILQNNHSQLITIKQLLCRKKNIPVVSVFSDHFIALSLLDIVLAIILVIDHDYKKLCLKCSEVFREYVSEVFRRFTRHVSEVFQKFTRHVSEVFRRFPWEFVWGFRELVSVAISFSSSSHQ